MFVNHNEAWFSVTWISSYLSNGSEFDGAFVCSCIYIYNLTTLFCVLILFILILNRSRLSMSCPIEAVKDINDSKCRCCSIKGIDWVFSDLNYSFLNFSDLNSIVICNIHSSSSSFTFQVYACFRQIKIHHLQTDFMQMSLPDLEEKVIKIGVKD